MSVAAWLKRSWALPEMISRSLLCCALRFFAKKKTLDDPLLDCCFGIFSPRASPLCEVKMCFLLHDWPRLLATSSCRLNLGPAHDCYPDQISWELKSSSAEKWMPYSVKWSDIVSLTTLRSWQSAILWHFEHHASYIELQCLVDSYLTAIDVIMCYNENHEEGE